jgi:hypothetical protein
VQTLLSRVPLLVDAQGQPIHRDSKSRIIQPHRLRITESSFRVRHYGGKSGRKLLYDEEMENLIVNAGLTYLEGVALLTTTQIALSSWFVLITATAPTIAAADTMASHGGWTENQAYSQGTRPAWSGVAGAAGAATNSASPAVYTANAGSTAGGCCLVSNSTKGGTTGTLFSGVAFTGGDRTLISGDTLNVTYNQSVADDGV